MSPAPHSQVAHPTTLSPGALERFRRGDREAFVAVYDAHSADLRPLVARFFARPFEREEAIQEIWLQVHRMCQAYDPDRGPLMAWLRAVAVNRCREILRARSRRPDARQSVEDEDLPALDNPEAEARAARVRAAVARFSAGLAREDAEVLRLSLVEERSHEEVAVALGISVRRCKYLRMKLLARAAGDPELKAVLGEMVGS